ncbi:LOW QUALITY PROTEIN: helicase with zinc finger domain 2-like [Haliotis rubra]|uniref:LOW QUALITY PROTEIN: helicase with zinc finger domain 2-like n=1 Tax=Haliotis rubra TaxID=36100 RepID=UPI001EE510A2|nr:LOW QUALITY PROTEIN: helicase with zinc finger domain 2-like [Haliotis rubra]
MERAVGTSSRNCSTEESEEPGQASAIADESVPEEHKTTNLKRKKKKSKKIKFKPAFDLDNSFWGRLYENLERHPKAKTKDAEEHPSFWDTYGVEDTEVDSAGDGSDPSDMEEENDTSPVSWFDASKERYENNEDITDIIVGESLDIIYRPNESVSSVKEESSIEELQELLKNQPGKYKRCQIKLEGPHLAICKVLEERHTHEEIEIHGRGKCGRTFNGDEVVVEILQRGSNGKDDKEVDNDKMYGRVAGILYSKFKETDFTVMACTSNSKEVHLMNPICNSVPKISVWRHFSREKEKKYNIDVYKVGDDGRLFFSNHFEIVPEKRRRYLFLVVYLLWRPECTYPQGAVVQVLDCKKNFQGCLDVLNTHFQVPRYYGKKTVSHVSELTGSPAIRTPTDEEDIRHMTVFTIDSADSRVLDDALSVWKTEREGVDVLLVGVHITDVTSVVTKGSAVDKEAEKRATSYLASERRGNHMMPEPLSQNILSLLPNSGRFVISVFFLFDKEGKQLGNPDVKRRFIRSCRMFSYQEVQAIIDDPAGSRNRDTDTKSSVLTLHILARHLRKQRLKNSRFEASLEDTKCIGIENENRDTDARRLVGEFMIKTNTFIASYLMDAFRHCVPLRCQADPPEDKLQLWVRREGYVKDFLVKLQDRPILGSTCSIDNQVEKNDNTETKYISVQKVVWDEILKAVALQDLKKVRYGMCCDVLHPLQGLAIEHLMNIEETAAYRCSSEKENTTHFSLNMFPYTHFTSPLRRYTDLIAHRLVSAVLDEKEAPYTQGEVSNICARMTEKHQRKKEFDRSYRVTRECKKFAKSPRTFNAIVDNVNTWQVTLFIPSLRGISFGRLELPFNLLDCSRNPKLRTLPEGKKEVLCFWNKRFYTCEEQTTGDRRHARETFELAEEEHAGQEQDMVYRRTDFREKHADDKSGERFDAEASESRRSLIDSNLHTTDIPSFQFAQFLKGVFKMSEEEEYTAISSTEGLQKLVPGLIPSAKHSEEEEDTAISSTEGLQRLVPGLRSLVPSAKHSEEGTRRLVSSGSGLAWHYIEFSLSFSPGQVVRVQIHAAPDRGLPAPYVQLFHICDNFDLCLTHMDDPVAIFAKYVSVPVKDRKFRCIEEYQNGWLPVLEMESATSSVGSEQTIVIDDAEVTIVKKNLKGNIIYVGTIGLDPKFCDSRQIEIGGKSVEMLEKMKLGESSFSNLNYASLDYLCIRHAVDKDSSVWVGHAIVRKVKLKKPVGRYVDIDPDAGTVIVTFELRRNSPQPPSMLMGKPFGATVEIIPKSQADRRTEQMIVALEPQGDYLAKNIALSRFDLLNTREWCQRLALCMKSPTDLTDEERRCSTTTINNESQTKAIRRALEYPFSLIQGPPGTGKTTIGVKLVFLFDRINKQMFSEGHDQKRKQVLFCGPSNKSVDLVARSLLKKLGKDICPKFLRVYGKSVEQADFPVPVRIYASNKRRKIQKSDPELKEVTLHHVIRQTDKPHAPKIRDYDERFRRYLNSSTTKRENITLEDVKAYDKLINDAEKEELEKYDVILCTCIVAGRWSIRKTVTVHQVIIDESGMCTEPQSMIPIIANHPEQVVLIGDHRQLRPIIQCQAAAELGLDQSLFERYRANIAFLNMQYRMHPEICKFPKNQFYLGKLETGPSNPEEADWYIAPGKELSIWPVSTNPKVFCHIEGEEETFTVTTQDGNEMSKSNVKEADKLAEVFMYLVQVKQIPVKDINLMSQYNAQRSLIKGKLEDKLAKDPHLSTQLEDLTVQTVVASQGSEWDYVIFSTVRSLPHYKIESNPTFGWCKHNLGFITDANQINVAITRARKGLIIIGNSNLLQCDKVLKQLIAMYRKEGCFVTSTFWPNKSS